MVDLWTQHAPARGLNDTYSAFLYTTGVMNVITNFTQQLQRDPAAKLFVYLPWVCVLARAANNVLLECRLEVELI